jgi:hypothetical protein
MAQAVADPISAIANAVGDIAGSIGNIWSSIVQKKIAIQEGLNLDKMTEQEKLRYYQAVQTGNTTILNQMLLDQQSKTSSSDMTVKLIIGFTFLIVLIIIYLKIRKK